MLNRSPRTAESISPANRRRRWPKLALLTAAVALGMGRPAEAGLIERYIVDFGNGVEAMASLHEVNTVYNRFDAKIFRTAAVGKRGVQFPVTPPDISEGFLPASAMPPGFKKVRMTFLVRSPSGWGPVWGDSLDMVPLEVRATVGVIDGRLHSLGVVATLERGRAWNSLPFGPRSIANRLSPGQGLSVAGGSEGLWDTMSSTMTAAVHNNRAALGLDYDPSAGIVVSQTGRLGQFQPHSSDLNTRATLWEQVALDRHGPEHERVMGINGPRFAAMVQSGEASMYPMAVAPAHGPRSRLRGYLANARIGSSPGRPGVTYGMGLWDTAGLGAKFLEGVAVEAGADPAGMPSARASAAVDDILYGSARNKQLIAEVANEGLHNGTGMYWWMQRRIYNTRVGAMNWWANVGGVMSGRAWRDVYEYVP